MKKNASKSSTKAARRPRHFFVAGRRKSGAVVEIDRKRLEQLEALAREAQGLLTTMYGHHEDDSTTEMGPWTNPMFSLLDKLGLPVRIWDGNDEGGEIEIMDAETWCRRCPLSKKDRMSRLAVEARLDAERAQKSLSPAQVAG